jgi:hypothetical protein
MRSTFTSSHTLWTTTKTFVAAMASATCFTTSEKAWLSAIYNGWSTPVAGVVFGFSSGFFISTADRNFLIDMWTKMLLVRNN